MSSNTNQNTNPHIDDRDAAPQPGMIAGHAEYIKGAAEVCFFCPPVLSALSITATNVDAAKQAAIGNITGSHAWTTSGEQDKAHAKASLQKASEGRDPAASGYGSVEETAGKITGCEWMKKEGAASKSHQE